MIETYDLPRGSGKTKSVIQQMNEDESMWCIVPSVNLKRLYPVELHNRIISGSMDLQTSIVSRRIQKVILDEGFSYKKDMLAKIYYLLGSRNIDVVAYGTV